MFEGQPKGLFTLALANTGERFGYYTMLAVFVLFLQENFGLSASAAGSIYSTFLMFVYFLPFIGGIMADKFGYSKMVTLGIVVMFLGYVMLSIPAGTGTLAYGSMIAALAFISLGTGLFKGNLQVMVGNLYDDPKYSNKRDSAFSIFYMAINIGALFAPSTAVAIMKWAQENMGASVADSYHYAFGVACLSLIVSMAIYYLGRPTFAQVLTDKKKEDANAKATHHEEELTPAQTKERVVALCLVFAVVIFFWMAFHQNGLTLTYFARDYVQTESTGVQSMMFNVWNLVLVIIAVYSSFSLFQSSSSKGKAISAAVLAIAGAGLYGMYLNTPATTAVDAPIFQQFNPFFVVALTPVSLAFFGMLAKRNAEPSAPKKIGLGMLIAAIGFIVIAMGSLNLATPDAQIAGINEGADVTRVSANWLVSTYLVLTFAELFLSPMGISFVSKVAPPKMKGMMMGGWFVATAIGNLLTVVPAMIWGSYELTIVWGLLIALCLISAIFIFAILKRLEKVA
ncbi:amino acid/peptide transporter [gut metagenome]|uniref:Amino acid/peptide transporter n=1 Tax=gut metagenome TaxID=749906 RepID=J9D829_9ZZZZ